MRGRRGVGWRGGGAGRDVAFMLYQDTGRIELSCADCHIGCWFKRALTDGRVWRQYRPGETPACAGSWWGGGSGSERKALLLRLGNRESAKRMVFAAFTFKCSPKFAETAKVIQNIPPWLKIKVQLLQLLILFQPVQSNHVWMFNVSINLGEFDQQINGNQMISSKAAQVWLYPIWRHLKSHASVYKPHEASCQEEELKSKSAVTLSEEINAVELKPRQWITHLKKEDWKKNNSEKCRYWFWTGSFVSEHLRDLDLGSDWRPVHVTGVNPVAWTSSIHVVVGVWDCEGAQTAGTRFRRWGRWKHEHFRLKHSCYLTCAAGTRFRRSCKGDQGGGMMTWLSLRHADRLNS